MSKKKVYEGQRFAAKLLFQFRVSVGRKSNTMRTCEERIVIIRAATAKSALTVANRRGKAAQHNYKILPVTLSTLNLWE